MGEELDLAAKTSAEVVAALAEKSGVLAIPKAYANFIAARIRQWLYPRLVEGAMAAAEKIKASGLPPRAFAALDEPLITAILEGIAEESDPSLREAWENLLANAATDGSPEVRRAFPKILAELDPADAALLNNLNVGEMLRKFRDDEVDFIALENLVRLGLVKYNYASPLRHLDMSPTPLGRAFLMACREPGRPEEVDPGESGVD